MKQTTELTNRPFFSIIIPMYNRAATIRRCLDSCFCQSFKDYGIVVVDDGSEDDSVAIVESYLSRSNILLVKGEKNRGVCAARGMGVSHSNGKWLAFIGSDDAFLPNAFQTMHDDIIAAPQNVFEVRFCYLQDGLNVVTPIPMMPEGVLGFQDYLRWCDRLISADLLYCHKREVYNVVKWPNDRQYETLFHIQIASKFKMLMSKNVVATVYDDAPNRITKSPQDSLDERQKQIARDNAASKEEILRSYNRELKACCPRYYKAIVKMAGNFNMRCGRRGRGSCFLARYLFRKPFDVEAWALLFLGLLGPKALHKAGVSFRRNRPKT